MISDTDNGRTWATYLKRLRFDNQLPDTLRIPDQAVLCDDALTQLIILCIIISSNCYYTANISLSLSFLKSL